MSAADSIELPPWAVVSEKRRAHIARVTALLTRWAEAMRLTAAEREAWRDAGRWHDALRDASEAELRAMTGDPPMPAALLHGPATATRLAIEGETREDVLDAIRWHTTGRPDWARTGRALYMADFLEPGRRFDVERRARAARVRRGVPERRAASHRVDHARGARPARGDRTAVERSPLSARVVRLGALFAVLVLAVAAYVAYGRRHALSTLVSDDARAPAGVRIRVEVLNASTVRGLARRATMYLRDRGFDVVENGSAPAADRRDSTLVLDRSHHADWAALAARAMGGARIETRPDTLRDVDLTVLVGAAWRPPAEPFYP